MKILILLFILIAIIDIAAIISNKNIEEDTNEYK